MTNLQARLAAAIRLLCPDEMTPTARNVLLRILEEYPSEAAPTGAASSIPEGEQ